MPVTIFWTPERDQILRDGYRRSVKTKILAEKLGCSDMAVRNRARQLCLRQAKRKDAFKPYIPDKNIRLSVEAADFLDAWREQQDPVPTRSEAILMLLSEVSMPLLRAA